jgi:hypothetical protein
MVVFPEMNDYDIPVRPKGEPMPLNPNFLKLGTSRGKKVFAMPVNRITHCSGI